MSLSALPWLCRFAFAVFVRARVRVYIIFTSYEINTPAPLSRQANITVHNHFTHPGRPLRSPLSRIDSRRGGQTWDRHPTQGSTVLDLVSALSVAQISHDAAPGRCRRSPALRALELLPAIDGALKAAPMLAKELRAPH